MLKRDLHMAIKRLRTQRLYSAINIVGLAVGLASFILIGLFVQYELSYDRQWEKSERIYRVSRDVFASGLTAEAEPAGMPWRAAALLKQDFPQIDKAAKIDCCGAVVKTNQGDAVVELGYASADNELFEIFDFTWLRGNPSTALTGPYDIVLTRSAARRHFGDSDPMGQTLLSGGGGPSGWIQHEVVGVIEDLPDNTHLSFDLLGSELFWNTVDGAEQFLDDWDNNVFHTYLLLRDGAEVTEIRDQSGEFFERHLETGSSAYTGFTVTEIADIHLGSHRDDEMKTPGSAATVYMFSAIAAFVLLLACINFVNLATAQSTARAREIGVLKVVGAGRGRVMAQFLTESVLVAVIAVLVAVMIVELALPSFNLYTGLELRLDYARDPTVAGALLLLALVTGLLAGAYPSLYLSAFQPQRVLRGDTARGVRVTAFRQALVVLQFSISIALLIGTAIVYQQMQFVRGIELGYETDRIVVISPNNVEGEEWETLKREWLSHPEITHVTGSERVPFERNQRTAAIRPIDTEPRTARMPFLRVEDAFFETYEIEVIAGRSFSEAFGTDQSASQGDGAGQGATPFIINELAARQLGWRPEDAVGRWLELDSVQGSRFLVRDARGPVVGVVENVYFESIHHAIEPTVYMPGSGSASLKLTGRDLEGTLAYINEKWKEFRPDLPVSPRFLDQDFEALYRAEQRQAQMFATFSALSILIACLGLTGLASFAAERRTKEIGVRKVMGGTVIDIVRLFTGEFSKLVLVANVIAWPAAYVLMQRWLESFAYRIDLSLLYFVGSGALALAIAVLTVGTITARAAGVNAIRSLRYE